jgi:hypothetical protein
VRTLLTRGLAGAAAWVAVGAGLRVAFEAAPVTAAVAEPLPGAVAFGVVYAAVTYWRTDDDDDEDDSGGGGGGADGSD